MLRFYGSDLKAIVTESITTDKSVVLAKDHGVYLMVDGGEQRDDGRVRHLAYADGCHPDLDRNGSRWPAYWSAAIALKKGYR